MPSGATPEERAAFDRQVRDAGGDDTGETEEAPAPAPPRSRPAARLAAGGAAANYATQSGATESVSIAMAVVLVSMLVGAGWLGGVRDWVFNATGKHGTGTAAAK